MQGFSIVAKAKKQARSGDGGVQVPVWTWRDAIRQTAVPPLTKLVCYSIANYVADVGKGCFPGVDTLMADTGLSNRSIATHIEHAREANLLDVQRSRGPSGQHRRTVYLPRFPNNAVLPKGAAAVDMRGTHDAESDANFQVNEAHMGDGHVNEAHSARPGEVNSLGPCEPDAPPCEPDDADRVKMVHAYKDELSTEPSTKNPPPLPPAGGRVGRTRRGSEIEDAISAVIADRPDNANRRFAIEALLAPIVRQRKLDAPSVEGTLRSLADWLALKALTEDEATAICSAVLATRRATVKPSDIEDGVKARIGLRPERAMICGDSELMRRWPRVLDDLSQHIGPDRAHAWFSTVVIESIEHGRARLATHRQFVTAHISREYSAQVRASLDAVFGGVTSVEFCTRRRAA